jgi:hypothetical protein
VKRAARDWGVFALVQAALCVAVYGSAIWGARLLAPLDIAPAIFPAYKFVDPNSNGVPDNHYIIDQLAYDLPLQTVIYDAYRRGEIPWWDPYTHGGRPLLADAHINGTDPIRILCYLTLPFELAYNWNLILHSVVAAAGMFALLRFWRFRIFTCTVLAIAWQFSGAFVLHFGHPWIAGTFVWFPLIWLFWERALAKERSFVRNTAYASFLCGAVFYSGNLQSHLYLPVFALALMLGRFPAGRQALLRATASVSISGLLGAALAAPVLANQVEFFLLSSRDVATNLEWWKHPARLLLSLGGIFPWVFGTFRTFDVGRVVDSTGAAWLMFCGSAITGLAIVGALSGRRLSMTSRRIWATSLWLVGVYLVVAGTPLYHIFYLRMAPLGILGLIPLAAIGLGAVLSSEWMARCKLAITCSVLAVLVAATINAIALVAYPAFKERLANAALAADAVNRTFPTGSKALRLFQVDNFPAEVSLRNLETALSLLSLLLLSAAIGCKDKGRRRRLVYGAVVFSLLPVIGFAARFIPDHPVSKFKLLHAGGPAQKRAIDLVAQSGGRILDREMRVFPFAMGSLYRVHTVHGYSALQPPGIFRRPKHAELPPEFGADFALCLSDAGSLSVEPLSTHPPLGRLIPASDQEVVVAEETLNTLTIRQKESLPLAFYRSDTPYPGWTNYHPQTVFEIENGVYTIVKVEKAAPNGYITFTYIPQFLDTGKIALNIAAAILLAAIASSFLTDALKRFASHRDIV